MKTKTFLFILSLTTFIFAGCQNNDLSAENQSLKQQIAELRQQITTLEQPNETTPSQEQQAENNNNMTTVSSNTANTASSEISATIYSLEELTVMVNEFEANVGSVTPDVNNSGNLDQFFSLKREGNKIEHALENYENSLEDQYRAGSITREDYRKLDMEIEKLDDLLDSACDRLEITFGIDD
ncbi:MAG: hypothetical protein IKW30_02320 [Lachnospiraceae bacterium]|nr:hypothetical protein [Lachnospiraceae bacterium]